MKILLTGASSFTGYWFARTLAEAGHEVVAPLLRPRAAYNGDTRAERVARLESIVRLEPDCAFGGPRFLNLLSEGFDLLAHHGAQVTDYRSPDFDVVAAVAANTHNIGQVLCSGSIGAVLVTSSVFAPGEGAGSLPLRAFSPYGLSKGITNDVFAYYSERIGVRMGRFVIPNPFGPLEETRFCAYLMGKWTEGATAKVSTPLYIRDNIHVDLLARAYLRYATDLVSGSAPAAIFPSGYVGSQADFARRYAREIGPRLGLACDIEFAIQSEFSEPLMRVNTDPADVYVEGWDEQRSWDAIAEASRRQPTYAQD
jgi:UDP-glucose 4-epimerase